MGGELPHQQHSLQWHLHRKAGELMPVWGQTNSFRTSFVRKYFCDLGTFLNCSNLNIEIHYLDKK
jgi:hypothetical protein